MIPVPCTVLKGSDHLNFKVKAIKFCTLIYFYLSVVRMCIKYYTCCAEYNYVHNVHMRIMSTQFIVISSINLCHITRSDDTPGSCPIKCAPAGIQEQN